MVIPFVLQLNPSKGNVAFGSGLHGWGFTLRQIAAFYAAKLGVDEKKLLKKLWGNHFYNPETRQWAKSPQKGYVRGFNKFVLEPIYRVSILQVIQANYIYNSFQHNGYSNYLLMCHTNGSIKSSL